MSLLVFDIGGTSIRCAAFRDGAIGPVGRVPSETVRQAAEPVAALREVLRALGQAAEPSPEFVSLGVPGPVQDGVVHRLPSLLGPAYQGGLDAIALAAEIWPGIAAAAANDLTMAGHLYVARGHRDFGALTLGSGVGGKLFVDGRPLLGRTGFGGEIGHWRFPGGPATPCDCGGVGHLSGMASGRGIARLAAARGVATTAEALVAAYHAGQGQAVAVLEESADALGAAIAAMGLAAGIEAFFLTGGFAVAAGEPYRARVEAAARASAWDQGEPFAVHLASPGEEPGLLGAGFYGLAQQRERAHGPGPEG